MSILFKPELAQKVQDRKKTQTRRLVKPGDYESYDPENGNADGVSNNGRVRWQVGKDYAVCPGRGKFAVCRIRVLKIWREDVRKIGTSDAIAEGFANEYEFLGKWMSINSKDVYRITDEELAAGLYHVDDDNKLVTPDARWGFHRGRGKGFDFLNDEQAYHRLLWDMPLSLFDAWAIKFELV